MARLAALACALLVGGALAGGEYSFYQEAFPTGMFFTWSSSSGASGTIEYSPSGEAGTAVADEGNGGTTKRVVLQPYDASCEPFPAVTK